MVIEGIYKNGKITPLEHLDLVDNTIVKIVVPLKKDKKSIIHLAGAWKDYKTSDGKSLDELKKEIYDSRSHSTRKEVRF